MGREVPTGMGKGGLEKEGERESEYDLIVQFFFVTIVTIVATS